MHQHEPDQEPAKATPKEPNSPAWLGELLDITKTVKYGSITLIIQDGIVIQIDKNEKIRLMHSKQP